MMSHAPLGMMTSGCRPPCRLWGVFLPPWPAETAVVGSEICGGSLKISISSSDLSNVIHYRGLNQKSTPQSKWDVNTLRLSMHNHLKRLSLMEAFYMKITSWQWITASAASEQTCAICKTFKSPSASQQRLLKDIKTGNPGTFHSLTHPFVSAHHAYRFPGNRNKLSLFIVLLIYGSFVGKHEVYMYTVLCSYLLVHSRFSTLRRSSLFSLLHVSTLWSDRSIAALLTEWRRFNSVGSFYCSGNDGRYFTD